MLYWRLYIRPQRKILQGFKDFLNILENTGGYIIRPTIVLLKLGAVLDN